MLIHGDASFAGQGVVAETLNLDALAGYTTGGTLHLIANNQVGFTTEPSEGRSTRYSSDLAKGFDVPIIHVNADDPEAAIAAIRLAMAYRRRSGRDVVVDLVGYRRFGHNEQDEPAYTQPLMAHAIAEHPTVQRALRGEARRGGRRRRRGGRADRGRGRRRPEGGARRGSRSRCGAEPARSERLPADDRRRRRHRRRGGRLRALNEQLLARAGRASRCTRS